MSLETRVVHLNGLFPGFRAPFRDVCAMCEIISFLLGQMSGIAIPRQVFRLIRISGAISFHGSASAQAYAGAVKRESGVYRCPV